MSTLEFLEELTGEAWTGLRFEQREPRPPATDLQRLCTAVGRSFTRELVLDCAELTCVGAPRNLGRGSGDARLAERMADHAGVPLERAISILADTPCFPEPQRFVRMGRIDDPDVVLAYLTPAAAMKLLRRWQLVHGRSLQTSLSSFMSVCSCVAAAGSARRPAFSFGCGDAREHGGLGADRLVVALPVELACELQCFTPPDDATPPNGAPAETSPARRGRDPS